MKPGPSTPAASPASTPDNLRERLDQFMPLLKRPLSLEVIRKVKDADIDGIRQLVNARQKHVVTYRNAKFGVGAVGMTPSAKDCIFLSDQRDVFARVWDELGLYEIFRAGFRDGNYNLKFIMCYICM